MRAQPSSHLTLGQIRSSFDRSHNAFAKSSCGQWLLIGALDKHRKSLSNAAPSANELNESRKSNRAIRLAKGLRSSRCSSRIWNCKNDKQKRSKKCVGRQKIMQISRMIDGSDAAVKSQLSPEDIFGFTGENVHANISSLLRA